MYITQALIEEQLELYGVRHHEVLRFIKSIIKNNIQNDRFNFPIYNAASYGTLYSNGGCPLAHLKAASHARKEVLEMAAFLTSRGTIIETNTLYAPMLPTQSYPYTPESHAHSIYVKAHVQANREERIASSLEQLLNSISILPQGSYNVAELISSLDYYCKNMDALSRPNMINSLICELISYVKDTYATQLTLSSQLAKEVSYVRSNVLPNIGNPERLYAVLVSHVSSALNPHSANENCREIMEAVEGQLNMMLISKHTINNLSDSQNALERMSLESLKTSLKIKIVAGILYFEINKAVKEIREKLNETN